MNKRSKIVLAVVLALCISFTLAACGGGAAQQPAEPTPGPSDTATTPAAPSGDAPATIKIGIPTPFTGVISGFGKASPWTENLAADAVNAQGGIYIKDYDKSIPIELVFADSESDQTKTTEVAEAMATKDKVNMFLARHTPDTTIPVALTGEKYGIPTVSNGCPTDPLMAAGPFKWVYQGFWDTPGSVGAFVSMWKDLGYGPGTKIGLLLPNDADALAWKATILKLFDQEGFIAVDSGGYEMGNQDWTNIINIFKQGGVQIICGNDIAPNFSSFITQATQQDLHYEMITMGRAFLFPSDANALPMSVINGLTNELWWTPALPFKSSIDGMTAQELADKWMAYSNDDWYATLGDKYSAMEIAINALKNAASLDPEKIRLALEATDLDTIEAHIKYVDHVCVTPVGGGQWIMNDDGKTVSIHLVNTGNFPDNVQVERPITALKDLAN